MHYSCPHLHVACGLQLDTLHLSKPLKAINHNLKGNVVFELHVGKSNHLKRRKRKGKKRKKEQSSPPWGKGRWSDHLEITIFAASYINIS